MIIEAVRLVVTLGATASGFLLGETAPQWLGTHPDANVSVIVGSLLGAGIGYVFGGLLGRSIRRGIDHAPEVAQRATGAELFAGTFGLVAGLLVGSVAAAPAIILLPAFAGWPLGTLLVIVAAALGSSIFSARADDLLAAAGLGRRRVRLVSHGERPAASTHVIDSSAAIDGRILELARARLVTGEIWVPGYVLDELQGIADSGKKERRRRGRRGLDVLDALAAVPGVELRPDERTYPEFPNVDAKLVGLCADTGATLVTTDHNLSAAAGLRGIRVLNPHTLGESLRHLPMSGELVDLLIEKAGSEPGQGVGFLDDGTLVVVEGGASSIGQKVAVEVASAMRTSLGRILFAKMDG